MSSANAAPDRNHATRVAVRESVIRGLSSIGPTGKEEPPLRHRQQQQHQHLSSTSRQPQNVFVLNCAGPGGAGCGDCCRRGMKEEKTTGRKEGRGGAGKVAAAIVPNRTKAGSCGPIKDVSKDLLVFFFLIFKVRVGLMLIRNIPLSVGSKKMGRRVSEVQEWNSAVSKARQAHDRLRACPGPAALAGQVQGKCTVYTGRLHTVPRPVGALGPMLQHHAAPPGSRPNNHSLPCRACA